MAMFQVTQTSQSVFTVTVTPAPVQNITAATGLPGIDGRSLTSGSGAPTASIGNNGDFYIDTVANKLYGPKAGGVWPAGVSLVGTNGWSPIFAVASDGQRRVLQVVDWVRV